MEARAIAWARHRPTRAGNGSLPHVKDVFWDCEGTAFQRAEIGRQDKDS